MSYSDRFAGYAEGVIAAPLDERLAFIRKTYLHVTGAMAAFVGLSYVFFQMSLGLTILSWPKPTRTGCRRRAHGLELPSLSQASVRLAGCSSTATAGRCCPRGARHFSQ